MREDKTPIEVRLERLVRGLSVFTFVLLSWTIHRATRPRESCVSSNFIRAILIQNQRVDNCAVESRLRLGGPDLSRENLARLRALEIDGALTEWFAPDSRLVIEVSEKDPRAFDLYRGALRIGAAWVDEGLQVRRALVMALLRAQPNFAEASHFQIETLADFITLTAFGNARWRDRRGREHDFARDVRLATAAPSFQAYCQSPLRSLAHQKACRANAAPDAQGAVWGLRPTLAAGLARTYAGLSLAQKMKVHAAVRAGATLPKMTSPAGDAVEDLVEWFTRTLRAHAGALQMLTNADGARAMARALIQLDVTAPLHWEVTFDLRHTPRWREIAAQLTTRAKFRPRERALVFTPEGAIALPSGLPVAWAGRDVQSQKHVIVACHFPAPDRAVGIRADQVFARQTCGTLSNSFWD